LIETVKDLHTSALGAEHCEDGVESFSQERVGEDRAGHNRSA
jgi:hypothetical protein